MAYYVCSGAKLKCSMGSKQSELEVVHLTERVLLCGKPMANIMDSKPMVNIKPFGQCSSLANPVVASATSANYGRLQKMPCIPNIPFPWLNGKMNLIIKGSQALLSTSNCTCVWAATIEVADPGQNTVREDGPMNITITEPTVETQQALGRGLLSSQDTAGIATQGAMASGFQTSQDGVASSSQSSQSTDVEPKVVEMYWSYGEGYKRLSDKARFYTDLNLHVKTENYKDGDSVSVTLKRKDGQPLFGTTKTLDLTGTVSNNEAVVENALKSYPLYVLSEITAVCSGVKSSIHPRRPKWEDVYGGYPKITKDGSETDMYTDDVFKYILGSNYDRKMFNNGGAARVSVSLIEAGMDLKKDFLVQDGSEFKKKLVQKNSDNGNKRIGFIASAKNLQEWLSSVWGKADVEIKGKTTIDAVQSAINGRNGVYIILGGFDSGASGATTLWLGGSNDALGGLNYVYKGGTVYFWELKGEKDVRKCLLECKYKHISSEIHKKLGCVHYGKIRKLFEDNANRGELPKKEFDLFKLTEEHMNVGKTDFRENGVAKFRFYDIEDGGELLTNIEADSSGHEGLTPYQATIHEIWHYMDYLAAKNKPVNTYSLWYAEEALFKAIKDDFEKIIEKYPSREIFCRNFYNIELRRLLEDLNDDERPQLAYFFDVIEGISIISEIEGYGTTYSTPKEQRERRYWTNKTLSSEYFAGIGCIRTTGNTSILRIINHYLPKAYEAYKKIIESISKERTQ